MALRKDRSTMAELSSQYDEELFDNTRHEDASPRSAPTKFKSFMPSTEGNVESKGEIRQLNKRDVSRPEDHTIDTPTPSSKGCPSVAGNRKTLRTLKTRKLRKSANGKAGNVSMAPVASLPLSLSRERLASTDTHSPTEPPMIVDGSDAGCSPLPAVSDAPVPAAELENATARRDAGESRFGQSDASNHDKVKRKENTISILEDRQIPVVKAKPRREIRRVLNQMNEFRNRSQEGYAKQLELIGYLQGPVDPMVVARMLRELVRYNQDLIEKHAESSRKYSSLDQQKGDISEGTGSSKVWNQDEMPIESFKTLNERLDAYSKSLTAEMPIEVTPLTEAAATEPKQLVQNRNQQVIPGSTRRKDSSVHSETKRINLAFWKTLTMSEEQSKEMARVIPVYLAYLAVGIMNSEDYSTASRILWEYQNLKTKDERDAKMRELIAAAIQFTEEKEPVLRKELSDVQALRRRAQGKKETSSLRKKISCLHNAVSLTTRLRSRYMASTSDVSEDSISLSDELTRVGQLAINPSHPRNVRIQQGIVIQPKSETETKANHPIFAEPSGDWSNAQNSAGDSPCAKKPVKSKIYNVQIRSAASIESGIKGEPQPSDDPFFHTRSSNVQVLQPFIQKHKPQRAAAIVVSSPTQPQFVGNSAPSGTQAKASASSRASVEEGAASSMVSWAGELHVGRLNSSQSSNSNTAQQASSLFNAAFSRVHQVFSKVSDSSEIGKRHVFESEKLPSEELHISTSVTERTMIGSLSRRLITWFGGSYLHNERLVATDASHNVSLDEAKPSTFTTDWDSIGYPNFGHWLAGRMGSLSEREAAYVLRLLPLSNPIAFGRQAILGQWRDELRKNFKNLSSYSAEVNDKRIKVHLDEVTPNNDEISISSIGKLQIREARRLQKRLKQDTSVLEISTMGLFGINAQGRLHGTGEILIGSDRPIRDLCEMGPHVGSPSEVDLAALLRGLQMVRDTFEERGDSREFRQYRRLLFTTGSIMGLRAVSGAGAHGQHEQELKRTTQIAALCRMQAAEILKKQQNIDSVHFIWLPPNAGAMRKS